MADFINDLLDGVLAMFFICFFYNFYKYPGSRLLVTIIFLVCLFIIAYFKRLLS
jgi:hypothetical protein